MDIIAQSDGAGQLTHKRRMTREELWERLELNQAVRVRRDVTKFQIYDLDGRLLARWLPQSQTLFYNPAPRNGHNGGGRDGQQVDELDPGTMDDDLKAEHFFRARKRTRTMRGNGDGNAAPQFLHTPQDDEYWIERGYVKVRTVGGSGYEWVRATEEDNV